MIFIPIHLVQYCGSYSDSKTLLLKIRKKQVDFKKLIFLNLEFFCVSDFRGLSDSELHGLSDDLYPNSFGSILWELWRFKDTAFENQEKTG